jgi:predicted phosphoadenosine phosphosulfate sulfurtransferase
MPKRYTNQNVLEAAKERISFVFDNFERVYVSFSGGKDSTVMLHLVVDEAIKRNKKIGVLFVDLEGQYKLTILHIERCLNLYKDYIEKFWVCLPIHLRNAVSVYEPFWVCWDKEKIADWVRDFPFDCISDENYFPFFCSGMEFEEFVPEFGEWYSNNKLTACFVGIRADESLNRFRTIASESKIRFGDRQFTTKVTDHVYNIYPIYDWKTQDIWIYQGKNYDKPYNKLYDYMHKAGLTIHQMRICQPYGDDQRRGLWLFHLIEPETWGKIVARVNGANSGALYIRESGNINGYGKINKPLNHTYKSFCELLLKSMPNKIKLHFENKINLFVNIWIKRGYENGIPDFADYRLEREKKIPSWRRICKTILRNDYCCKNLGFSQPHSYNYLIYLNKKEIYGSGSLWQ